MKDPTVETLIIALVDITNFAKQCRHKSDTETFIMLDRFYHAIADVVAPAGGRIVKGMGDGVLMTFPEAEAKDAADCLVALEERSRDLCSEFGEDCAARVHAHVGNVATGPLGPDQHFDVVGMPVNELFMMPWDGPMFSEALNRLIDDAS